MRRNTITSRLVTSIARSMDTKPGLDARPRWWRRVLIDVMQEYA
jgi:hypothetical protein